MQTAARSREGQELGWWRVGSSKEGWLARDRQELKARRWTSGQDINPTRYWGAVSYLARDIEY